MAQCASCGSECQDGKRFCGDCGAAVDLTSAPTETSLDSEPPAASHPTPDQARFIPGTVLAKRYRIVGLLGRGGMGEVYRADDLKLGQPVALKFLPQAVQRDQARLDRFLNEVKTALKVSHPNVCRVHDIGEVDGQHYLSMEYVDGEDLASLLRRIGHLPQDKAVQIARQLCAGLAAAHEQGILHRDLKPANVMIDGRGRAKITDFGLAGLAEGIDGDEIRAGTPPYMSPEQHGGKEVTVRSDLYALGLVLYELFTGKRAFEGATDLGRSPQESAPTTPSDHVKGLDPTVERVILRCLETEPASRPGSALAVAAALPGGDPLAAALAAGETPSPEMVADAGETGGLRPAVGLALLAAIAIGVVVGVLRPEQRLTALTVALNDSPAALEVKAREIVTLAGYEDDSADSIHSIGFDGDYIDYVEEHDPSPGRWEKLATVRPAPIRFFYRQSPRSLVPSNGFGAVNEEDPPLTVSGMVNLWLDPDGRLLEFLAVPPQRDESQESSPEVDWSVIFDRAGLDLGSFTPVRPVWNPLVYCDRRLAWEGTFSEQPEVPIRVEAGSYRDRPVHFAIVTPWTKAWRQEVATRETAERVADVIGLVFMLLVAVGGLLLARRNLRLGRGDRGGAFRLAAYVFAILIINWLVQTHHVIELAEILMLFLGTAIWLFVSILFWLVYIALEPYMRRLWPTSLISWSRLLAGRLRDPRIGRDILIGGAVFAGFTTLNYGYDLLERSIGLPPSAPMGWPLPYLSGVRAMVAKLCFNQGNALLSAFFLLFLIMLLRVVLRRQWAAIGALVVIFAIPTLLTSETPIMDGSFGAVQAVAYLFVLTRFGLLAGVSLFLFERLNGFLPLIGELPAWYAQSAVFDALLLAALATYGFYISLAGRPLFTGDFLDEPGG